VFGACAADAYAAIASTSAASSGVEAVSQRVAEVRRGSDERDERFAINALERDVASLIVGHRVAIRVAARLLLQLLK
jgi:hypothetical protein